MTIFFHLTLLSLVVKASLCLCLSICLPLSLSLSLSPPPPTKKSSMASVIVTDSDGQRLDCSSMQVRAFLHGSLMREREREREREKREEHHGSNQRLALSNSQVQENHQKEYLKVREFINQTVASVASQSRSSTWHDWIGPSFSCSSLYPL